MKRGFTLVELLVALAVGGILSVLVYGLFDSTSDSLFEVENLSDANDRMRFATEQIRNDLQSAGGHATPDSEFDVWAVPGSITPTAYRVIGISTFSDAQNRRDQLTTSPIADVAAENPDVSFDDIIVMGAYDYPVSFELANVRTGVPAVIRRNLRGLERLWAADPFSDELVATTIIDPATTFGNLMGHRVMRITDRQGRVQFAGITAFGNDGVGGMTMTLTDLLYKGAGQELGLDVSPDGDVAYEAALIDAFRYHVERDPLDPTNLRLMKTRLCAGPLMADLLDPSTVSRATLDINAVACAASPQQVVIADRVADFQVWLDCSDPLTGALSNTEFRGNWLDATSAPWDIGGACMDAATYRPARARRAHVRLSMYAPQERKDLRHYRFEDSSGNVGDIARDNGARLATFDVLPDLEGAAPVVTLQTSVELPNFAFRNSRL